MHFLGKPKESVQGHSLARPLRPGRAACTEIAFACRLGTAPSDQRAQGYMVPPSS